jgi:hypothetical protein
VTFLIAASLPAMAQDWKGKSELRGVIVDDGGAPVKDAQVSLRLGSNTDGPKAAKTNGKGEFRISNLKDGQWSVEVGAPNFAVRRMRVDVTGKASLDVKLVAFASLQSTITAGNDFFNQKQYAQARGEFEKILVAQPELTDLHRNIAYTYSMEKNHAKTIEHIDKLIDAEKSGNTSGLMQLPVSPAEAKNELMLMGVESSLGLKNYDKMNGYLKELDDTVLGEPAALLNIAIGLINNDKYDLAIEILDRTAKSFADSPLPHFYRGLAKLRAEKNAEAKPDLEKFVQMASAAPEFANQVKQAQDLIAKIK